MTKKKVEPEDLPSDHYSDFPDEVVLPHGERVVIPTEEGARLPFTPPEGITLTSIKHAVVDHDPPRKSMFDADRVFPPQGEDWPDESLVEQERHSVWYACLFPLLYKRVQTPQGPGTLVEVTNILGRPVAGVLLDRDTSSSVAEE